MHIDSYKIVKSFHCIHFPPKIKLYLGIILLSRADYDRVLLLRVSN